MGANRSYTGMDVAAQLEASIQHPTKRGNIFTQSASPANGYPPPYRERISEVLMAAWMWLEHEGLLLPVPGNHDRDWVFVSQRGRALLSKENFEAYRYGRMFPHQTLHPAISSNTFALFIRGHYDTVVFEAFRAVEVAVRDATGLPQNLVGSPLMRFNVDTGPLTDMALVESERQAMSDLFSAAMRLFKNPTSHRAEAINLPQDAVSLVMFADYLLRLVEQRVQTRGAAGGTPSDTHST